MVAVIGRNRGDRAAVGVLGEWLADLPAGEAVLPSLRLPGSAYQGAARNDPISAVDGCDHRNIESESSVG